MPAAQLEHAILDCGSAGIYVIDVERGVTRIAIPDHPDVPLTARGTIYERASVKSLMGLPVFRWKSKAEK